MHRDRAEVLLIVIAFIGAVFTPCRPLISASAQSVYEAAGENGERGSVSGRVVNEKGAQSTSPMLKARCPCGCDERPALAGSSPGLGIALISRAPGVAPLPGDQEVYNLISSPPASPPPSIDTVPRSA